MGSVTEAIKEAFRAYETAGVPGSGAHDVSKQEVFAIGPIIEAAIASAGLGGVVSVTYATRAALDADLDWDAGTVGLVYADSTDANNDIYTKAGASGAGSWSRGTALHDIIEGLAQGYVDQVEYVAQGKRLWFHRDILWDSQARTIYVPKASWKRPDNSGGVGSNTPPSGNYYTVDVSAASTGVLWLYYDTSIASGSNPIGTVANGGSFTFDGNKVLLARITDRVVVWEDGFPARRVSREDPTVEKLASNLKAVLVTTTGYGVTPPAMMIPLTTRYVVDGPANAYTSVNTIANAASSSVDPTGTYDWSLYAELPLIYTSENTVWLDPGDNTVKVNARTTRMRGTQAGFVALARWHTNGTLSDLGSGLEVIRAGQDPVALAGQVATLQAVVDSLSTGGAAVLVSDGLSLRRYRRKRAALLAGGSAQIVLMLTGDSWHDRELIPQEIVRRIEAMGETIVASGSVSPSNFAGPNGEYVRDDDDSGTAGQPSSSWAGAWTRYDNGGADDVEGNVAPDGYVLVTTSADQSKVITYNALIGTRVNIEYHDTDAAAEFRYRVVETNAAGTSDVGTLVGWTTVAADGGNDYPVIQETVAPGGSNRCRVEISPTTGNAGTITVTHVWMDAPGASGWIVSKCANGGSTSINMADRVAAKARLLGNFPADVEILSDMVNDQRTEVSPDTWESNILAEIDASRAVVDDIGYCIPVAPRNDDEGDGSIPGMQAFGAKAELVRQARSMVEVSRADVFWGTYDDEGGSTTDGMFQDANHLKSSASKGAGVRFVGDWFGKWLEVL